MANAKRYVFTPARRAALRKAQLASAKKRKKNPIQRHGKSVGMAAAKAYLDGGPASAADVAGRKATGIAMRGAKKGVTRAVKPHLPKSINQVKVGTGVGRGTGIKGLRKNTIPYARVNKRSSTVGVNAGTIIPGTKKRIVVGGYGKIESINKHTAVDSAIAGRKAKLFPTGTRRRKAASRTHGFLKHHGVLKNPATRLNVSGSQVRLGTSRVAGPTVIVRRGGHKTAQPISKKGVQKYNSRMSVIAGKKAKKPRPQRRRAAKKRKRK
jgi:hypothetical protein